MSIQPRNVTFKMFSVAVPTEPDGRANILTAPFDRLQQEPHIWQLRKDMTMRHLGKLYLSVMGAGSPTAAGLSRVGYERHPSAS